MSRDMKRIVAASAIVLVFGVAANARVMRVVIDHRESPAYQGQSFGEAGKYERLSGHAYGELDPKDPLNAVITDLQFAPRNSRGMVEYSTPVYILRPVHRERGNHRLFYDINNRGNKNLGNRYNDTSGSANANDPTAPADFGDAFMLRRGYAVAWAGWESDVRAGDNRMTSDLPVAEEEQ